jgi:hypothetical protein
MTTTPQPAMPPMPTHAPKPGPTRRTGWIITAGIAAVLAIITTVVWMNGRSYEDTVADCKKALGPTSTKTNRPDACDGVKGRLRRLLVYSIQNAFDDMPKTDQDTLDYYDDGSINGSLDAEAPHRMSGRGLRHAVGSLAGREPARRSCSTLTRRS